MWCLRCYVGGLTGKTETEEQRLVRLVCEADKAVGEREKNRELEEAVHGLKEQVDRLKKRLEDQRLINTVCVCT